MGWLRTTVVYGSCYNDLLHRNGPSEIRYLLTEHLDLACVLLIRSMCVHMQAFTP